MRFTKAQYNVAIQHLMDAAEQLEPDGKCCACCGDSGHQAFECGFNPLVAMALCKQIADDSRQLHETLHSGIINSEEKLHEILHWNAGFETRMGESIGPSIVRMPQP